VAQFNLLAARRPRGHFVEKAGSSFIGLLEHKTHFEFDPTTFDHYVDSIEAGNIRLNKIKTNAAPSKTLMPVFISLPAVDAPSRTHRGLELGRYLGHIMTDDGGNLPLLPLR